MPTRPDVPDPDDTTTPGSAKAMTEQERKELLATNRQAREQARRKEEAKKAADAEQDTDEAADEAGDESGAETGGDEATGDTAAIDPARVPGVVKKPEPRPGSGRGLLIGLSAAIVALLVGIGVLGFFYSQARSDALGPDSSFGQEAMADASRYAAQVLTYAPGDYADLDRRIREVSTPEFADRYIEASAEARRGNDAAEATSASAAVDAGLMSITKDRAVVLVALDQTLTSPELPAAGEEGVTYQRRTKVTLQRDGDRWLIADLVTV